MKKIAADRNYKVFKKAQEHPLSVKDLEEKMRIADGRLSQHDASIKALQDAMKAHHPEASPYIGK